MEQGKKEQVSEGRIYGELNVVKKNEMLQSFKDVKKKKTEVVCKRRLVNILQVISERDKERENEKRWREKEKVR